MTTKRCTKCGQIKSLAEFNFRNKQKGVRNTRCNVCTRLVTQAAYYKNRDYYLQRVAERNKVVKQTKQHFLYDYLCQHSCIDCGIQDPIVLQFDHVQGRKSFAISNMLHNRFSLIAIKREMEKCVVRCANCHARKTALERGYYAYLNSLD